MRGADEESLWQSGQLGKHSSQVLVNVNFKNVTNTTHVLFFVNILKITLEIYSILFSLMLLLFYVIMVFDFKYFGNKKILNISVYLSSRIIVLLTMLD